MVIPANDITSASSAMTAGLEDLLYMMGVPLLLNRIVNVQDMRKGGSSRVNGEPPS
jgi:hypothetical protein